MSRALDHIVHAVRDLDAVAGLYRRLGFTVGARNRHPWGTHNHVVQLPGFFIELLTLAEPEKLGDDAISVNFGAFHRDFLAKHEGLSMLLLASNDAAADAGAFAQAGIASSQATRFDREGRRPDGSLVKLAFSLVFARDPTAPDLGCAVCQHHYPENFWSPAFQQHANGVTGVLGVALVADDPAVHADFLRGYSGAEIVSSPGRISATAPRGEIIVVEPARYRDEFNLDTKNVSRGTQFAAIRFAARDLDAASDLLNANAIKATRIGERVVIGPDAAMGAAFIIEPTGR
ncbi:MAG TPA: VOC family protein [Pseudolabrys sp.]|nr:VOC family protein [Pseudolabrys sp.]